MSLSSEKIETGHEISKATLAEYSDIISDIKHILTKTSSALDATGKMMLLCESGCMVNLPGKNQ